MKRFLRRDSHENPRQGQGSTRRGSLDNGQSKTGRTRRVSLAVENPSSRRRSTSTLSSGPTGITGNDWQPDVRPVRSSLPHIGFSARNENWNSVQQAVLALFRREELETTQLVQLVARVESLAKSDIGPFIYDYYKNQLLKKGMRQMREVIKKNIDNESPELESLGEAWDYFYKEILPSLHYMLHSVSVKDLTVKQATLVEFRDNVLLRFDVADWLDKRKGGIVPPSIQQMLLVLQSVPPKDPPGEKYLQLESLVARVVSPYLGYRGLYLGKPEPSIKANRTDQGRRNHPVPVMGRADSMIIPAITVDMDTFTSPSDRELQRKGSQPSMLSSMASLAPVVEMDPAGGGAGVGLDHRRHSFTGL